MVEVVTVGRLLAGVALLAGNAFFVTTEFAMTRVRQFDRSEFADSAGLERAWEMTERLEVYLSGCQLGITICSVGLGVAAEPALAALADPAIRALGVAGLLGGGGAGDAGAAAGGAAGGAGGGHTVLAVAVSLAAINLLHLTVGEQAPTYLGIERTRTIARYGAPVLYWWTRLLSPVIRFADWSAKAILSLLGVEITRSWAEEEAGGDEQEGPPVRSRGELLSHMGDVLSTMDLPDERRDEVMNAVAIDRIEVEDIMVDRDEIVAVSTADPLEEGLSTIRETPHTRVPLVGESLDDPVGTVYVSELLRRLDAVESGETDLATVAAPPMTVGPDMPVSDLIDAFQDAHQELAVVVDDGHTLGLVTATDAFEEIAGELEDPLDEAIEGTP